MLGDVVGYAVINQNPETGIGVDIDSFKNKTVRVLEFSEHDGSILALSPKGDSIGMFDSKDILRSFRCTEFGEYIMPPDLDIVEKMNYVFKCMNRKGGYNSLLKQFVIAASIHKGKFDDSTIWQNQ